MQIAGHGCWRCTRNRCLLAGCRATWLRVNTDAGWSPEQISGWLKTRYPNNESMHVSHETLSQPVHLSARTLKKRADGPPAVEAAQLRARVCQRTWTPRGPDRSMAISIRERPAEAEDRAIPGHWEGDLLAGRTAILRRGGAASRFLMLIKVPSKDTAGVVRR